jgi:hypothetical protein
MMCLKIRLIKILPTKANTPLPKCIIRNQVMRRRSIQHTHIHRLTRLLGPLQALVDLGQHFVNHRLQPPDILGGEEGGERCTPCFV